MRFERFEQVRCIVPNLFEQGFGGIGSVSGESCADRDIFDVVFGLADIGCQSFQKTVEGVEFIGTVGITEPHGCADAFCDGLFEQGGFSGFEFGSGEVV